MRIFVIGNTPGGIAWVVRILEELTGMKSVDCEVGVKYENASELELEDFEKFADNTIFNANSTSQQNVKCFFKDIKGTDYVVVVGRNIEDCVCESLKGDGLKGMTFGEGLNFIMEKEPHSVYDICREWFELAVKIHNERCVNVEYVDLCEDLKKVVNDFVEKLKIKILKNKVMHVLEFCSVDAINSPTAMNQCGRSLLDGKSLLKIANIKKQIRRK